MEASVIVATFNRQAILVETLTHLLNQKGPEYEIIVVDQTPSVGPGLREFLARGSSRINYHALPRPNLPAARNYGVARAKAEVVIFVDDDVVVESDFVARHVRHYADRSIGGVTGLSIIPADGAEDALRALESRHNAPAPLREGSVVPVSWLSGCHMSLRKTALLQAGSFDERFTGSALCEDVDMSIRIRTLGHRLIADTGIRLVHLALKEGGCEVRGAPSDRKAREEFALAAYCWLKNRRRIGLPRSARMIFRAYRTYAMNGNLLRDARWKLVSRQIPAIAEIVRAARAAWGSAMIGQPTPRYE